jgi:DNA topoisomerase-1
MEEDLDRIAGGDEQRAAWLHKFYFGSGHGGSGSASAAAADDRAPTGGLPDVSRGGLGLKELVDDLGEIDAREISTIQIGDGIVVRVGRYGPYVEETVPQGVDLSTGERSAGAAKTPLRATINDVIAPDEMTPA